MWLHSRQTATGWFLAERLELTLQEGRAPLTTAVTDFCFVPSPLVSRPVPLFYPQCSRQKKCMKGELDQISFCAQHSNAFHETQSENWFPSCVRTPAWSVLPSTVLYSGWYMLLSLFQLHWLSWDILTHHPWYSYLSWEPGLPDTLWIIL